ncbi:hypothetical protein BD779DRAFT_1494206 [Infundibulicybe gibba]|nr:hypothetical protein BD779DRAFT_1494206 [Infundibulicybe gibba]
MSAHTQPGRPSEPIPINTRTGRSRSASLIHGATYPLSASATHPARIAIPSPGSSPILSYFLQSPTGKTPGTATFPFKRKFGTAPVFEEGASPCCFLRCV